MLVKGATVGFFVIGRFVFDCDNEDTPCAEIQWILKQRSASQFESQVGNEWGIRKPAEKT